MKSYPFFTAYRAVLAFFTHWKRRAQPTVILSPNPIAVDGLLRLNVLNAGRRSVSIKVLTKENKSVLSRQLVSTTPDYITAFHLPAGLQPDMYQVVVKVAGRPEERVWLVLEEAEASVGIAVVRPAASSWLKHLRDRQAALNGRAPLLSALLLTLSLPSALFMPGAPLRAQVLSEASGASTACEPDWKAIPPAPVAISGRVVDERGLPLDGATVEVLGSHAPCSTNATGNFLLSAYLRGSEQLFISISYLGYLSVVRPINATFLDVALEPAPDTKKYRASAKVRRYRRHLKPD